MLFYPQVARSATLVLPGISIAAGGGMLQDHAAMATGDDHRYFSEVGFADKRPCHGETSSWPTAPVSGHHHCSGNLGSVGALLLCHEWARANFGHHLFGWPSVSRFSDFVPPLIPHPPKNIS